MHCGLCKNVNRKYVCSSMPAGGIELGCSDVTGGRKISGSDFSQFAGCFTGLSGLRFVNLFFTLCDRISRPRRSKREI